MQYGTAQSYDIYLGAEGLTPALLLAKDGAAFAATSGSLTEKASGWYTWAATAVDMRFLNGALMVSDDALTEPRCFYLETAAPITVDNTAVLAELDALETLINGIGGTAHDIYARVIGIVIQRSWAQDPITGDLHITAGDAYGAHGVPAFGWPTLGIDFSEAELRFEVGASYAKVITATQINAGLQRWVVEMALTPDDSRAMPAGAFVIRAYWENGDRVTLPISGKVVKQ